MPVKAVSIVTKNGRDARLLFDLGHVARLARLRVLALAVRAVLPFLEIHLLGKGAYHLSRRRSHFGVERVARRAELRLLDVRGLHLLEAGYGSHDRLPSRIDLERSEDDAI